MPVMPRQKGKAKKIAYSIMGVPANMVYKRDKREKFIARRLLFEETARVR